MSVLECADGVFGVAALGRVVSVQSLWDHERCQNQSGDFADFATARQNLAEDSTGPDLGLIQSLIEQFTRFRVELRRMTERNWKETGNVHLAERREGRDALALN